MYNPRRTLAQCWSFQQATVLCIVDFASVFDAVKIYSLRRIMAVEGGGDKFKCPGSTFIVFGQDTEEIRGRVYFARSAFPRMQSRLLLWRELSLPTKGRIYQAVVCSILLHSCETWPMRVSDERMLAVFETTASAASYT